jgi:peptide/nickel transport system permease protein
MPAFHGAGRKEVGALQGYIVRRLLQGLLVLFIASILIFVTVRILPGDPVLTRSGATNIWSEEMAKEMRHKFGLDKPIPLQYLEWMGGALRGDFGYSFFNQYSVTELVQRKLPATLELTIASVLAALIIALPLGIIAALRQNTIVDYIISGFVTIGMALPGFWLGIMLMAIFSVQLRWVPSGGYIPFTEDPIANLRLLFLPAATLAIIFAAPIMRFLRSGLLEVLRQDYIRTARGKGLVENRVIVGHALKNALIPTVTILGIIVSSLLGGVVMIEWVFTWPGLGWIAVDAIYKRDYSIVQTVTLLITLMVVVVNLLVDVSYAMLDPRIRYR